MKYRVFSIKYFLRDNVSGVFQLYIIDGQNTA